MMEFLVFSFGFAVGVFVCALFTYRRIEDALHQGYCEGYLDGDRWSSAMEKARRGTR